jgi:hypothetical protein
MGQRGARTAKLLFILSSLFFLFIISMGFGFAVGKYNSWPYEAIRTMYHHINSVVIAGEWLPEGRVVQPPAAAARQRTVFHRASALMPGYRAIMGWDHQLGKHAIWLYDETGQQLHTWTVDYDALKADDPAGLDRTPHGMEVLNDGSVLVNFDGKMGKTALARLDSCGNPLWSRTDAAYHHSIEPGPDGTFWTWRGEEDERDCRQSMVNFASADGDTIQEFDLIEDFLVHSPAAATVFGLPTDFESKCQTHDIFHPNDVEVLTEDLANRFPDFRIGDLLVSLRTPNLVAVIDAEGRSLKWWSHGPWHGQHDPDFGHDGRIWVYDNGQTEYATSRVMAIDPAERQIETIPAAGASRFYSRFMGKHQMLPNENHLVVVPGEGRVLELSPDGEVIFEFNNLVNDRANAHVQNAQWLPGDFFVEVPACG